MIYQLRVDSVGFSCKHELRFVRASFVWLTQGEWGTDLALSTFFLPVLLTPLYEMSNAFVSSA